MCTIGHVESLLTPTQNMQKDLKQIIAGVPSYSILFMRMWETLGTPQKKASQD